MSVLPMSGLRTPKVTRLRPLGGSTIGLLLVLDYVRQLVVCAHTGILPAGVIIRRGIGIGRFFFDVFTNAHPSFVRCSLSILVIGRWCRFSPFNHCLPFAAPDYFPTIALYHGG
jgi:hypothetical protein